MKADMYDTISALCLRVINSQDLEKPLHNLYLGMKKYFPLDLMNLPSMDPRRGTLHYMAIITDEGTMLVNETIKLSAGGRRYSQEVTEKKIIVWNNLATNELMQDVAAHMGVRDPVSTLVLSTPTSPLLYGALGLVAMGTGRYSAAHQQALEKLYEPLAGVTRHALSQFEIRIINENLAMENRDLRRRLGFMSVGQIVGRTTGLKAVMEQVERVAPLESLVLLMGETGVGKEAVAHAVHRLSSRANGPLITLNCGAIPETLLESELFGYEKGAFTGAVGLRRGYFEQADGGTIFLDEISELSLPAQVKLLRLLQTMEFQRVGGSRTVAVNVRVIAATNRDLAVMVKNRQFRGDLWFRLNVFPIRIPPLRDRKEDIPALADYFIRRKSQEMNIRGSFRLTPDALKQLQNYDWPGNVREFQNVIERALIVCRGEELVFPDLSQSAAKPEDSQDIPENGRFASLDEMIAGHIKRSLIIARGRVSGPGGAAELLRVNPSTLRARMRKLGISLRRLPG